MTLTWIGITILSNSNWQSFCYGDDKFVAVCDSNNPVYSSDEINLTEITMPVSANWRSICYGNGKFVAIDYSASSNIDA